MLFIRRMVDEEYTPPDPQKPHFSHPKAVVFDAAWWIEEFHMLPKAGGVFDQDKLLMDDVKLFFRAKSKIRRDYATWKKLRNKP